MGPPPRDLPLNTLRKGRSWGAESPATVSMICIQGPGDYVGGQGLVYVSQLMGEGMKNDKEVL